MDEYESLSHSKWEFKYHVVFILKGRRKVLYKSLRQHLGEVFRKLAEQKESRIEEGHLQTDHVHMMISILPKYAISQVVGFIKGKNAIHLARVYGELQKTILHQPVTVNAAHLPGLKDVLSILLQLAENFHSSGEFFIWSGNNLLCLCTFIATCE